MMKCFLIAVLLSFQVQAMGQVTLPPLDKSPLDVSYCPDNYPLLRIQEKATAPLIARVVYSRPAMNGRTIFGELIEYGKVWRLGANEATEIEFYRPVTIGKVKIKKGKYTLYTIPFEDKWTMILNKETDIWGSFKYDMKKDVMRTEVPVVKDSSVQENFSMMFVKTNSGYDLQCYWENVHISLPIIPEKL